MTFIWRGKTRLDWKSDICRRAGGLDAIRMLRKKERFLLCMKIMREIGRQGFAKKFEAAAMKEIFDEKVLELVKAKQTDAEVVLDLLKQAVEFGIGTEKELAKRAFLLLLGNGTFLTELARKAGMDLYGFEFKKQKVLFALANDLPMSSLQANGMFWNRNLDFDRGVQMMVHYTIRKKIDKGDYERAAEIAFAFGLKEIADGIERSCKVLGIPLIYERHRLETAVI